MSIIVTVSSMIIPAIMLFIVGYGMIKRKNVYDDFVNGAKDGFTTVIKVMPTLIGLMVAVGVLRESGFMTDLGNALGKFTDPIGFPGQLLPVTIVKIFSFNIMADNIHFINNAPPYARDHPKAVFTRKNI